MLSETQVQRKYVAAQNCMIFLVIVCLLPVMQKPNIWYDESFTINLVRKSIPELFRITALDVHPPLYYLIVKLFVTILGDHLVVYHIPSLLFYVLLLLLTARFFTRFFDARTAALVTAAFCSLPHMLKYALELRMYSLCMLLILSGFYLAYLIVIQNDTSEKWNLNSFRPWFFLALINVASAYTHYFAGVAAAGISLFLLVFVLWKHGLKPRVHLLYWGIFCVIMIVLYLPWLPTLLAQMSAVKQSYWIGPLTEAALHETPEIIFSMPNNVMSMALKVFFVLGLFLFAAHCSRDTRYIWLAGCYFVVGAWLTFGILYSLLRSPVFVDRYLIMLLPLIWIPVLISYTMIDARYVYHALCILFTLCFIQNYENQYDLYAASPNIPMLQFAEEHIKSDDVFFHFYIQSLSIGDAYFPDHEHYMLTGVLDKEKALAELTGCQQVESVEQLLQISGDIWCLDNSYPNLFEEAGFQIETYDVGTQQINHIYRKDPSK